MRTQGMEEQSAVAEQSPVRRTRPRREGQNPTSEYTALLHAVRSAGLLERRRGFYLLLFAGLMVALAAVVAGMLATGDSWWQLAWAVVLGLLLAQLGFVAHEASHREIFASGKANDLAGLIIGDLIVGISFSWWKAGHNRHHANPNILGKDPSVDQGAFSFTPEDAASTRGPYRWYIRRQAWFFFPVLMLAGLNLHAQGLVAVFGRAKVEHRVAEASLLVLRNAGYVLAIFLLLPPGKALAFLGVQIVVFGVAIASAFVPNHVGMPVLPRGSNVDFLRRQVVTSRNIRGGWWMTAWMGGLNYQIEHHLFPSMPRPNLRAASRLTREYCRDRDIPYTVDSLPVAYGAVLRFMDEVGIAAAGRATRCPAASMMGR